MGIFNRRDRAITLPVFSSISPVSFAAAAGPTRILASMLVFGVPRVTDRQLL